MKSSSSSGAVFSAIKEEFERKLLIDIAKYEETALSSACKYSLVSGGKRIRPIIVYLMNLSLNSKEDVSDAALCLEYFHTASLIADDLPCMDNDDYRREVLTCHKKFGEATALLASYSLITAAFEKIYEAVKKSALTDKENRGLVALKEVSFAAGMFGATGGQFFDLFSKKGSLNEFSLIVERKTVRLFEVSFLLGWIFGGGELSLLEEIRKLGYHFGFAFQLADDLFDLKQDLSKEQNANMAIYLGSEKAKELFEEHLRAFEKKLYSLEIEKEELLLLKERLCEKVSQSLFH